MLQSMSDIQVEKMKIFHLDPILDKNVFYRGQSN